MLHTNACSGSEWESLDHQHIIAILCQRRTDVYDLMADTFERIVRTQQFLATSREKLGLCSREHRSLPWD